MEGNNTQLIEKVIIEKIKKEDLSPGDYLVLSVTENYTFEQLQKLGIILNKVANSLGCTSIVLEKGMKLSILHKVKVDDNEQTTITQETM